MSKEVILMLHATFGVPGLIAAVRVFDVGVSVILGLVLAQVGPARDGAAGVILAG